MKILSSISPRIFFGKNLLRLLTVFIVLVSMKSVPDEGNEYSVKAMFIYNFTKHIEWPSSETTGVFRIGVIGRSEIYEALETIATQKKVDGRSIELKMVEPEDNSFYQIIFVSKSQSHQVPELARKYMGTGVLIISEECKHSEHGAAINLITTDNRVRFELNQSSVRNAGLKVSVALANLAIVVNP